MKEYKTNIPEFRLTKTESDFKKVKLASSEDSYNYIKSFYFGDIEVYESFFMVLLNRANNTTGFVKISQGGVAGTVADLKLIAKYAIESLSSAVIVAHNHPSGNVKPSETDIRLTKKIKKGLELLDVTLLDHIILGEEEYYSFADEGIL